MTEFMEFPKIARFSREVIVTEKIDGTNAQVCITEDGEFLTGSRNRWITPENDNYGFSRWAHEHREELMTLGVGRHFGEWWGAGIQRKYGLTGNDKRFSLFNVQRWCLFGTEPEEIPQTNPTIVKKQEVLPPCVGLVPIVWKGTFDKLNVARVMECLLEFGSQAVNGFMQPEGIVIWHTKANIGFKKTFEKDSTGKWEVWL